MLVDLLQFLLTIVPILGWLISMVVSLYATMFFWLAFYHHGINLYGSNRILATLGAQLAETVPIINGFFWWTCRISVVVIGEWRRAV